MEWYLAGNEAQSLIWLGRYAAADELTRELLENQRAILGVPGLVNAGVSRVVLLDRLGRQQEARAVADEMLPLARGIGGSEFLGQFLREEAELERSRGNDAAARQALREAVEIAVDEDVIHVIPMLPTAARVLPREETERLIERVRDLPSTPLRDALRAEAEAVLTQDAGRFLEAAALYRDVEMPYEEARCLAAAGDADGAAAIYERLGAPAPRA
jgi:tetratricopeptide (TPR) repeat protein